MLPSYSSSRVATCLLLSLAAWWRRLANVSVAERAGYFLQESHKTYPCSTCNGFEGFACKKAVLSRAHKGLGPPEELPATEAAALEKGCDGSSAPDNDDLQRLPDVAVYCADPLEATAKGATGKIRVKAEVTHVRAHKIRKRPSANAMTVVTDVVNGRRQRSGTLEYVANVQVAALAIVHYPRLPPAGYCRLYASRHEDYTDDGVHLIGFHISLEAVRTNYRLGLKLKLFIGGLQVTSTVHGVPAWRQCAP
eukprot:6186957-Pleurochrysis_carterae.AAC.2